MRYCENEGGRRRICRTMASDTFLYSLTDYRWKAVGSAPVQHAARHTPLQLRNRKRGQATFLAASSASPASASSIPIPALLQSSLANLPSHRAKKKRGQATFLREEEGIRNDFAARGEDLVHLVCLVSLACLVQRTK